MWGQIRKQECSLYLLYLYNFWHTGTQSHASEAARQTSTEGLGVLLQNQTTSTRGRYKQRKLQSGLWRDASESFAATGPEKSPSYPRTPPKLLILSNCCCRHAVSTSSQLVTQSLKYVAMKAIIYFCANLCDCCFILLLNPKFSHLMFAREALTVVFWGFFLTLNKWGAGPERRYIQGYYQTFNKSKTRIKQKQLFLRRVYFTISSSSSNKIQTWGTNEL